MFCKIAARLWSYNLGELKVLLYLGELVVSLKRLKVRKPMVSSNQGLSLVGDNNLLMLVNVDEMKIMKI